MFFVFTYLVFRFFHSPWKAFGFFHTYALIATLILPFTLAYICKGTAFATKLAIIMSSILLLSPLTRPIFLPMVRNMTSIASWDMAIPFNLCNISALFYLVAILTKNKTLKNYMITFGLFGGLINNVQAHNTHMATFWYYLTWESFIVHMLIIVIPIFMLLTNQIQPSKKHVMYNAIWIFPFYLIAGFVINPLWNTNFHFTKPIAFTKALLPTMQNPWIIFGAQVNPLYMAVMAVFVTISCALLYFLSKCLYKYMRPLFNSNLKESKKNHKKLKQ